MLHSAGWQDLLEHRILTVGAPPAPSPSYTLPTPNEDLPIVQSHYPISPSDTADVNEVVPVNIHANTVEPIDVDALYKEGTAEPFQMIAARACNGYRLTFPEGKSPYSAYPFGLHDVLPLPWTITLVNEVMTIFSRQCTGRSNGEAGCCLSCQQLLKNKMIEGILTRLEEGVHPNAPFAYHGVSSLQELLQRKNTKIKFHRFRGLNQARKLLGKATALTEQKRLLMAISSGDVKRVDRVISVGLRQKKGVRGLLASVVAAAQGRYRPRSYTEEEDMYFLLIWRLSGNRVAGINHRAGLGPSVPYLRSRSIVPALIPSHGQPTTDQIATNVQSSLGSILDVIQEQIKGKTLHAVVILDELATEKRIRWDPTSNMFLGVCREHGYRTSLEFINEGDLEELFRRLDSVDENERVHYAGEVRNVSLCVWTLFASASTIDVFIYRPLLVPLAF